MAEDKARFRAAQRTEQRLSKSHFDGIGQGSARRDNMIRRTGPSVVARLPVRLVGAGWRGSPEKGGFPGVVIHVCHQGVRGCEIALGGGRAGSLQHGVQSGTDLGVLTRVGVQIAGPHVERLAQLGVQHDLVCVRHSAASPIVPSRRGRQRYTIGRALGALPANYLGSAQPEEKPTARSSPG